MEILGLLIDFGVPTIAAVGSGLVAYALTGGEDETNGANNRESARSVDGDNICEEEENGEFEEEKHNHEDVEDISQSFFNQSTGIRVETSINKLDEDLRTLQDISTSISRKVDLIQQTQPIWATQLLQKIDSISAVVEKIEAKLQVSGIASIGELSAAGPPTISIVDQHKQIINEALFAFYHSITDDLPDVPASDRWTTDPIYARRTSLPPSIVPACDMMLMFIKNVQRSPEMSRYRRIPANNANYRTLLLPAVGHKRVLRSVGFVLKGNAWEWQWLVDETNSTTPVTTTPTEDSILKKAVEVPTNKEDVILILSHVIEGLQQIRSNTFDLVYQPQSQQAIASAASSITCSSSSPSTPPPTAIDNSLANNSSSASSSTITSVDATNQVASTSEIVQETISQLASAPSSSSLPSSSDSVSSAQLSVDITESSETLSENLTNEQRPSVSEHRTPLSPELQEVLSKARAISVFSTSRGSLGVSSMATNSAAANLFAHNEIVRKTGFASPSAATTFKVATSSVGDCSAEDQFHYGEHDANRSVFDGGVDGETCHHDDDDDDVSKLLFADSYDTLLVNSSNNKT